MGVDGHRVRRGRARAGQTAGREAPAAGPRGVGAGPAGTGRADGSHAEVSSLAASMSFIPGMRHALAIPVEPAANWLFRMTESQGRAQWMSAVERFVMVYAILPIYILLAPAAVLTLTLSRPSSTR